MEIAIIAAVDQNWGIGKNNDLMWHLPKDMRFFKDTTEHHLVVMGRKNYDSIPLKYRPLTNRENIILTRNSLFKAEHCAVYHDLETCVAAYQDDPRTLFIIGGGEIYRLALEKLNIRTMYITKVEHAYDADTFFPEINESDWNVEVLFKQEVDEKHAQAFTVYKYSK